MHLISRFAFVLCALLALSTLTGHAQDSTARRGGITFSGFVRTDGLFDSRQSEVLREGGIMLYPKAPDMDAKGNDVNDAPVLGMIVLHTRLAGSITGPDALGAKSSAYMEGEFFGVSDADANGFRVRHAYVTLDWGSTKLLAGQYWHPMFVTTVIPAFNFAAPFIPYARNPQIRVTHTLGALSFIGTALAQSDFRSMGPDAAGKPTRSGSFLRNAAMPMFDLQCVYADNLLFAGVGADFKKLLPRLRDAGGASSSTIASTALTAFALLRGLPVTVKVQGVLGQNMSDVTMLGGYAATLVDSLGYTNQNVVSVWTELATGKELMLCLFAGYTKQLGTDEDVHPAAVVYGMAPLMDHVWRVAPSLHYTTGKMKFVAEAEYTGAIYGTRWNGARLRPEAFQYLHNIRVDAAVFYYF
jgi:hypothetical protein